MDEGKGSGVFPLVTLNVLALRLTKNALAI